MFCIQLFIISVETWEGSPVCVLSTAVCDDSGRQGGGLDAVVMVKDVSESQKAPQQQQLTKQWNQHQKQGKTFTQTHRDTRARPLSPCLTQPAPSCVSVSL